MHTAVAVAGIVCFLATAGVMLWLPAREQAGAGEGDTRPPDQPGVELSAELLDHRDGVAIRPDVPTAPEPAGSPGR